MLSLEAAFCGHGNSRLRAMKKLFITLRASLFYVLCPVTGSGVLASSRAIDMGRESGYGAGLPATFPTAKRLRILGLLRRERGADRRSLLSVEDRMILGHSLQHSRLHCGSLCILLGRVHSGSTAPCRYSVYNSGVTKLHQPSWIRTDEHEDLDIGLQAGSTFGAGSGGSVCTLTSGSNYAQGSTVLTCSGTAPSAGSLAVIQQCDTGMSGSGCTTGSEGDNGSIWICGQQTICSNQLANGNHEFQTQRCS